MQASELLMEVLRAVNVGQPKCLVLVPRRMDAIVQSKYFVALMDFYRQPWDRYSPALTTVNMEEQEVRFICFSDFDHRVLGLRGYGLFFDEDTQELLDENLKDNVDYFIQTRSQGYNPNL